MQKVTSQIQIVLLKMEVTLQENKEKNFILLMINQLLSRTILINILISHMII